ncbi:sigma-70 region 4 domain-containing protein [Sphingomonas sp. SUN019]|uniref:sigma-70 region 4 domain-containing protein n=1 Tax=Sphingomonas sp. SUN019 TaxID=2937788 RepID=UPI002164359D|nr:sigma-70 region 4 domain-containing protein [Sphingomonas sp. SUN019]UVO49489.1 sigma-70 region 4 domain-containing protein [Sphingomonas sp. SUN019]
MIPHPAGTARMARLAAVLRQMPERQRAIFLTVSNDEQTFAELAERFGISSAAVEQELARALVLLDGAADDAGSLGGRFCSAGSGGIPGADRCVSLAPPARLSRGGNHGYKR